MAFFLVIGLEIETLKIQGVEMSTGDSIESNVRSFEEFLMNYSSITTPHWWLKFKKVKKYIIILMSYREEIP
jgi:hypothetical protein